MVGLRFIPMGSSPPPPSPSFMLHVLGICVFQFIKRVEFHFVLNWDFRKSGFPIEDAINPTSSLDCNPTMMTFGGSAIENPHECEDYNKRTKEEHYSPCHVRAR